MKHEPIERAARPAPAGQQRDSLANDFALIGEAILDAFRGLSSSSRLESRWSTLRYGTCC